MLFLPFVNHRLLLVTNNLQKKQSSITVITEKIKYLPVRSIALWIYVKYIELNPLRAGLVEEAADYKCSTWDNYYPVTVTHLYIFWEITQ